MDQKKDSNLVLDAAFETIKGARRVLWLITSIICIGFFYLFLWYFSWEKARISARIGIIKEIDKNIKGKVYNYNNDTLIFYINKRNSYEKETKSLIINITKEKFNLPLIGITISSSDFSIGLMMVSAALLVWFYLYLNRLYSCLKILSKRQGWKVIVTLLQFHFVIIGNHGEKYVKKISNVLLFSLPTLSLLFLLSDILDLYNFPSDFLMALKDFSFVKYIILRLSNQVILVTIITSFAFLSKNKIINIEKELIDDNINYIVPQKETDF